MSTQIWSDGSCALPKGGAGGWGVVIKDYRGTTSMSGSIENTTSQRAELVAAIRALNSFKRSRNVTLYTDSQYLIRAIEGMKNPKKNADLLEVLNELTNIHKVMPVKVKSHTGVEENELAHSLAYDQQSIVAKSASVSHYHILAHPNSHEYILTEVDPLGNRGGGLQDVAGMIPTGEEITVRGSWSKKYKKSVDKKVSIWAKDYKPSKKRRKRRRWKTDPLGAGVRRKS